MREIHVSLWACWDFDPLTSNQFVPLSPLAHSDLSWWMWEYNVFQGSPIVHPDPTAHFLTDASQLGWGAHWGTRTISGRWTPEEAKRHINVLELDAVAKALGKWKHLLFGQRILVELDNSTAVAYLNHQGGTKSRALHSLTGHVFGLCAGVCSTLVAKHIPGRRNVLADSLSRGGACGIRRVDPQPLGLPRHLSSLGITHRRPVCHKTKHSSSHLHVPGLERDVGVCVPTTRLTSTDSSQDPVLALQNNLGRSVVASVTLVRSTSTTTSRLSSNTTTTTRPTHTGRDPSQGSFRTKDTRVAFIRQALTLRGISEPVAERAARPQRDSTIAIYESKWRRFVDWCSGRKIDPFSTSSAVIGDFLLFLFQQKLAISTLEGYRMAIASTLRATSGVEVGRCDTLRSLLKNLECERARSRRQAPDWDLSLVLRRLRLPPFEPLNTCSLQLLTWKTSFSRWLRGKGEERSTPFFWTLSLTPRTGHQSPFLSVLRFFQRQPCLTEEQTCCCQLRFRHSAI